MIALIASQAYFECLSVKHVSVPISTFRHVYRPGSIDRMLKGRLVATASTNGCVLTNSRCAYWQWVTSISTIIGTSAYRIRQARELAKLTGCRAMGKASGLKDDGSVRWKLDSCRDYIVL